jgi:hypothetical protein
MKNDNLCEKIEKEYTVVISRPLPSIVFGKCGNNVKSKFARNEEGRGLYVCFYRRSIRWVVRDACYHEHDVCRQTGRRAQRQLAEEMRKLPAGMQEAVFIGRQETRCPFVCGPLPSRQSSATNVHVN